MRNRTIKFQTRVYKEGDVKCQEQDTEKRMVQEKVAVKVAEEETEQIIADIQKRGNNANLSGLQQKNKSLG